MSLTDDKNAQTAELSDKPISFDTDDLVAAATTLSSALEEISDLFTYMNQYVPKFTKAEAAEDYSSAVSSLSEGLDSLANVLQWAQDTVNNFVYIEAILQGTNPATFSFSQYGISDAQGTMGQFAAGYNTNLGDASSGEKSTSVGVSATAFKGEGWEALTAQAGAGYELGELGVSASAYASAALFQYSQEVGFSEYDKWKLDVSLGGAKAEAGCIFSLVDSDGNFMPGIGAEVGASIWAARTEVAIEAGYGGENNNYIGGFIGGELEAGSAAASAEARLGMDEDHKFACKLGAEASAIACKAGLSGGLTVLGTDIGGNVEAKVGLEAKAEFGYSDGKFEATVGLTLVIGLEVGLVIDLSDTAETLENLWDDVGGWCKSTVSKVGDALESAGNTIKNAVVSTVDKIKSLAQTVAEKAENAANTLAEKAKKAAEEVAEKAKETYNKAKEEATSLYNKVKSAAKKVANTVKKGLKKAFSWLGF